MQHPEVSAVVGSIYGSLGIKGLILFVSNLAACHHTCWLQ